MLKWIVLSCNLDLVKLTLNSLFSYVKVLTPEHHEAAGRNEYNFDHPDAFDFDLAVETMKKLKEGRSVQVF